MPGEPASSEPREFGRDGVSGLLNPQRATRARDVSRPNDAEREAAVRAAAELIARRRR